jgi:hypothetical protein
VSRRRSSPKVRCGQALKASIARFAAGAQAQQKHARHPGQATGHSGTLAHRLSGLEGSGERHFSERRCEPRLEEPSAAVDKPQRKIVRSQPLRHLAL